MTLFRFGRPVGAHRHACLCGIVLLLTGATAVQAGSASYDLVLNVSPEKTLHYKLDSQSDGNFQGSAFTQTVSADIELTRVADAKSDNQVFTLHFIKVDSSMRQGDQLQTQELGLDGMKVVVEVTLHGRVTKTEPPPEATEPQKRLIGNFADAVFCALPEKPVKIGETWQTDLSKPGAGTTGMGEYTLDAVGKKQEMQVAKISGDLKIASQSPALTGTGHVQTEVAVAGGYALSSKGTVDLKGDGPSVEQSFDLKLEP